MAESGIRIFEEMLSAPEPGFWCVSSWKFDSPEFNLVRVVHKLNDPVSQETMSDIRSMAADQAESLLVCYGVFDGGALFVEQSTGEAGFSVATTDQWENELQEIQGYFDDPEYEWPPNWWDVVAFASPYQSADKFAFRTTGEHAGKVFFLQHDDFTEEPIADSLSDFLGMIAHDPAKLMYECGCYTRYSGGIPVRFVRDASDPGSPPDTLPDWFDE